MFTRQGLAEGLLPYHQALKRNLYIYIINKLIEKTNKKCFILQSKKTELLVIIWI